MRDNSARPVARDGDIAWEVVDVDEQPGFVVEGERVALGPVRLDLVPVY